MSALQFILRVIVVTVSKPAVQDIMTETAIYAARQAQRKLVQEVENSISKFERKRTTPTVR